MYYSHILPLLPSLSFPPPPSLPLLPSPSFPLPSFPPTSFPPPPSVPLSRSPSLKRHSTCTSNALMPVCRDSTQNWRPASMRYRAWCSQREERWYASPIPIPTWEYWYQHCNSLKGSSGNWLKACVLEYQLQGTWGVFHHDRG